MIRYIFIVMLSVVIAQETNQEIITFQSANPFSFEEIIMDLENQETQEVFGILTLPNNYNPDKKYPLIIGVAGSLNWGTHHLEYLQMYHKMDFATFQFHIQIKPFHNSPT